MTKLVGKIIEGSWKEGINNRKRGKEAIEKVTDDYYERNLFTDFQFRDKKVEDARSAQEKWREIQSVVQQELESEEVRANEYVSHKKRLEEKKKIESEYRRRQRQEEEVRKKVLIEFIIDGTYSFTTVFPKVFYIIESVMKQLKWKKEEYRGITIQYGLTVFHEKASPWKFSENKYFTESEEEFLDAVKSIEFYGGSSSGKEDLTGALRQAMCILQNEGGTDADRGFFLFSDSMPVDDDLHPDFTEEDQGDYMDKGVRFAELYTYENKYVPVLWMVDGNGNHAENGKNKPRGGSLQLLLSEDLDYVSETIEDIVGQVLNQISITKYS